MSDHPPFKRLTITQLQSDLFGLLRDIACNTGRVEIIGTRVNAIAY